MSNKIIVASQAQADKILSKKIAADGEGSWMIVPVGGKFEVAKITKVEPTSAVIAPKEEKTVESVLGTAPKAPKVKPSAKTLTVRLPGYAQWGGIESPKYVNCVNGEKPVSFGRENLISWSVDPETKEVTMVMPASYAKRRGVDHLAVHPTAEVASETPAPTELPEVVAEHIADQPSEEAAA